MLNKPQRFAHFDRIQIRIGICFIVHAQTPILHHYYHIKCYTVIYYIIVKLIVKHFKLSRGQVELVDTSI